MYCTQCARYRASWRAHRPRYCVDCGTKLAPVDPKRASSDLGRLLTLIDLIAGPDDAELRSQIERRTEWELALHLGRGPNVLYTPVFPACHFPEKLSDPPPAYCPFCGVAIAARAAGASRQDAPPTAAAVPPTDVAPATVPAASPPETTLPEAAAGVTAPPEEVAAQATEVASSTPVAPAARSPTPGLSANAPAVEPLHVAQPVPSPLSAPSPAIPSFPEPVTELPIGSSTAITPSGDAGAAGQSVPDPNAGPFRQARDDHADPHRVPPDSRRTATSAAIRLLRELRPVLYENLLLLLGGFLVVAGSIYFAHRYWARAGVFGPLVGGGLTAVYALGLAGAGYTLQRRYRAELTARVLYATTTAILPVVSILLSRPLSGGGIGAPVAGAALLALVAAAYPALFMAASLFQREIGRPFARAFIVLLLAAGLAPLVVSRFPVPWVLAYLYLTPLGLLSEYRRIREASRIFEIETFAYVIGGLGYGIGALVVGVALAGEGRLGLPEVTPLVLCVAAAATDLHVVWSERSKAIRGGLGVGGVLAHVAGISAVVIAWHDPYWRVANTLAAGGLFFVAALRHRQPRALHVALPTLAAGMALISAWLPAAPVLRGAGAGFFALPVALGAARVGARWRHNASPQFASVCERWVIIIAVAAVLGSLLPLVAPVVGAPIAGSVGSVWITAAAFVAAAGTLWMAWRWGRRPVYLAAATLLAGLAAPLSLLVARTASQAIVAAAALSVIVLTGVGLVLQARDDEPRANAFIRGATPALGVALLWIPIWILQEPALVVGGLWRAVLRVGTFVLTAGAAFAMSAAVGGQLAGLATTLSLAGAVAVGLAAAIPGGATAVMTATTLALGTLALSRASGWRVGRGRPFMSARLLSYTAVAASVVLLVPPLTSGGNLWTAGVTPGALLLALWGLAAERVRHASLHALQRSPQPLLSESLHRSSGPSGDRLFDWLDESSAGVSERPQAWPVHLAVLSLTLAAATVPRALGLPGVAGLDRAWAKTCLFAAVGVAIVLRAWLPTSSRTASWRRTHLNPPLDIAALLAPLLLVRADYDLASWLLDGHAGSGWLRHMLEALMFAAVAAWSHGSRAHAILAAASLVGLGAAGVGWVRWAGWLPIAGGESVFAMIGLSVGATLAWAVAAYVIRARWCSIRSPTGTLIDPVQRGDADITGSAHADVAGNGNEQSGEAIPLLGWWQLPSRKTLGELWGAPMAWCGALAALIAAASGVAVSVGAATGARPGSMLWLTADTVALLPLVGMSGGLRTAGGQRLLSAAMRRLLVHAAYATVVALGCEGARLLGIASGSLLLGSAALLVSVAGGIGARAAGFMTGQGAAEDAGRAATKGKAQGQVGRQRRPIPVSTWWSVPLLATSVCLAVSEVAEARQWAAHSPPPAVWAMALDAVLCALLLRSLASALLVHSCIALASAAAYLALVGPQVRLVLVLALSLGWMLLGLLLGLIAKRIERWAGAALPDLHASVLVWAAPISLLVASVFALAALAPPRIAEGMAQVLRVWNPNGEPVTQIWTWPALLVLAAALAVTWTRVVSGRRVGWAPAFFAGAAAIPVARWAVAGLTADPLLASLCGAVIAAAAVSAALDIIPERMWDRLGAQDEGYEESAAEVAAAVLTLAVGAAIAGTTGAVNVIGGRSAADLNALVLAVAGLAVIVRRRSSVVVIALATALALVSLGRPYFPTLLAAQSLMWTLAGQGLAHERAGGMLQTLRMVTPLVRRLRLRSATHLTAALLATLACGTIDLSSPTSIPAVLLVAVAACWLVLLHADDTGQQVVSVLAMAAAAALVLIVLQSAGWRAGWRPPWGGTLAALSLTLVAGAWIHDFIDRRYRTQLGRWSAFWTVLAVLLAVSSASMASSAPAAVHFGCGAATLVAAAAWFVTTAVRNESRAYGYAAQATLLSLWVWLRLGPGRGLLGAKHDTLAAVSLAYALHVVDEALRRARLNALREPAEMGVRLLPLLACAMTGLEALTSSERFDALRAAILAEGIAILYTLAQVRARDPLGARKPPGALGLAATAFYNGGLVLLWMHSGRHDWLYYTLPLGVSVIVLTRVYRDQLDHGNRIALRTMGTLLIFVTAYYGALTEAGAFRPLLLAALSLVGLAVGFGLRLRDLFLLSTGFLVLDVVTSLTRMGMQNHVIGWTFLTLVGIGLLAAGTVFQLRRAQILRALSQAHDAVDEWD